MSDRERRSRIAFLYVGGKHHVPHSAPVAATLALSPFVEVAAYVTTKDEAEMFRRIAATQGVSNIPIRMLSVPRWVSRLGRVKGIARIMKQLRLLASLGELRGFDALVTTERTSTVLKRLPGRCPLLFHIPHGAGDRARGFERRLRLFDLVIVAGEKDRRRMVADRIVEDERCVVSGYVKLGEIRRAPVAEAPKLFTNGKPAILYNPHFDRRLSSWEHARRIVETVRADGRFNLIVAPHIRLFDKAGDEDRERWSDLAEPGRIHVDLGSDRSCDMTYTDAGDIYLGDVSSQVYEFISRPKPCIFLDLHDRTPPDSPDYAFHAFGPVISDLADLPAALGAALRAPQAHAEAQRRMGRDAMGDFEHAAGNAAGMILQAVAPRRASGRRWLQAAGALVSTRPPSQWPAFARMRSASTKRSRRMRW